jgi:hypothetical protein
VHGATSPGGGYQQICLSRQKCWDLQYGANFSHGGRLLRFVDIRRDGKARGFCHPIQDS